MKKQIKDFLAGNQKDLYLAKEETIIVLTKNGANLLVEYKDNDMKAFAFGFEINTEDLKENVVIATIIAFINA